MCGRFTLKTPTDLVAQLFEVVAMSRLAPRYNIAPTQQVLAVRVNPEQAVRELTMLRWGLVPSWAKDLSISSKLINARADTVASKPAFRSAFKKRRCLIPVDGFYEWRTQGGAKQPLYIHRPDGLPFAFAGLWEHWTEPAPSNKGSLFAAEELEDRKTVESCSIITTDANALMAEFHDRMPVILPRDAFETWLDPNMQDTAELESMLRPCPPDWLEYWPVSSIVNNARNEVPECIEPIASSD